MNIPDHDDNTRGPCRLSGRPLTEEMLDWCSDHDCCYLCNDLGDAWERMRAPSRAHDPPQPAAIETRPYIEVLKRAYKPGALMGQSSVPVLPDPSLPPGKGWLVGSNGHAVAIDLDEDPKP